MHDFIRLYTAIIALHTLRKYRRPRSLADDTATPPSARLMTRRHLPANFEARRRRSARYDIAARIEIGIIIGISHYFRPCLIILAVEAVASFLMIYLCQAHWPNLLYAAHDLNTASRLLLYSQQNVKVIAMAQTCMPFIAAALRNAEYLVLRILLMS